jgi:hypothetical protein
MIKDLYDEFKPFIIITTIFLIICFGCEYISYQYKKKYLPENMTYIEYMISNPKIFIKLNEEQ